MKKRAEEEATGKSFWTREAPPNLRQKIMWEAERHAGVLNSYDSDSVLEQILGTAHHGATRDMGVTTLSGNSRPRRDFEHYFHHVSHEEFPDALEALTLGVVLSTGDYIVNQTTVRELNKAFNDRVNALLNEYRVSYSLERIEIVDFDSKELHEEVVVPTLQLLHEPKWKPVEDAYQKALKEISIDPADAITDATTALQEGFRVLGCKGSDLRSLMNDAKTKLFKGHDAKYVDAIEKLVEWASADRVNRGDTHKSTAASPDDAWLAVHTVGALLLSMSRIS